METNKFLAVSENGTIRVVARLDSVRGYEIPINLHLTVPDHYWETPLCSANIHLPEAPKDEINHVDADIAFGQADEPDEEDLDDI